MLPQLFDYEDVALGQKISTFHRSSLIRSIISFELDDECILSKLFTSDEIFFPQSPRLTYLRTTLWIFNDVRLFEDTFFRILSRVLPYLKSLEVNNRLEQQEKNKNHNKFD